MAHTFSKQLTAGTPENVNDVMTNFNEAATDYESAFAAYKSMVRIAAGGSTPSSTVGLLPANTASGAAGNGASVFYFDGADWVAGTRTMKLRLRVSLHVNQTAPGVNVTVGLYPVTVGYGAAGANNAWTVATVTAGSTVTISTPSASSSTTSNSGDFTAPSAGSYTIGWVASGAPAANTRIDLIAELQMRQV